MRESEQCLDHRLLQREDEERRCIARQLHDSAGQLLTALGLNLSAVEEGREGLAAASARALSESLKLVQELSRELRAVSHLLYPPLLDDVGLLPTLRWLAEGFAQQDGIQVALDAPEDFPRLPSQLEVALFRIAQESLTNVAEHSGSAAADIRLASDGCTVRLEVADQGRGIAATNGLSKQGAPPQFGVGIHAMRERVRQLEGELEIRSASTGTIVSVALPIAQPALRAAR
ncbi:MAG: sensor histidine kinase [Candidatus Acidiferrales bacterium]